RRHRAIQCQVIVPEGEDEAVDGGGAGPQGDAAAARQRGGEDVTRQLPQGQCHPVVVPPPVALALDPRREPGRSGGSEYGGVDIPGGDGDLPAQGGVGGEIADDEVAGGVEVPRPGVDGEGFETHLAPLAAGAEGDGGGLPQQCPDSRGQVAGGLIRRGLGGGRRVHQGRRQFDAIVSPVAGDRQVAVAGEGGEARQGQRQGLPVGV